MASERQIQANQLNAQKSTGPKTDEGKARSRRDALKHGLADAGVVLPEDEEAAVRDRSAEWNSSLKPFNAYEVWLSERVAVAAVRIERCERLERARRQRLTERALDDWDEDRRIEAERLGARLDDNPGAVALELQRTAQGCDWLLVRWHGLEQALECDRGWTEEQRRLALDMLGTPVELRDGVLPLVVQSDKEALRARKKTVRDEIAYLERRRAEILTARDEAEQRAAVAGETAETDPELALIRRYEEECHRRQRWALEQFKKGRHGPNTPDLALPRYPAPAPTDPAPADTTPLPPIRGGAPEPDEAPPNRPRGLQAAVFDASPTAGSPRACRDRRRLERRT